MLAANIIKYHEIYCISTRSAFIIATKKTKIFVGIYNIDKGKGLQI